MNAIILAGKDKSSKRQLRKQEKELKVAYPGEHYFIGEEEYKPLFRVNEKCLVQYVVDACANSKSIENVFVVGQKCRLEKELENCSIIESCGSLIKNALRGYSESNSEGNAVFLGCDIPLVKGEHIDEFINGCLKYDNGLCVSLVEQKYLKGHEMNNRKCFPLKEGNYRWANMFFGNPVKLNLDKLNRIVNLLYHNRKLMTSSAKRNIVLDLAKEIPVMKLFPKMLRYFVISRLFENQKLSMMELEQLTRNCLDIDLKLVETKHYEPSLDVDSREDLEYVRELMLDCEVPRPGFEPGSQPVS